MSFHLIMVGMDITGARPCYYFLEVTVEKSVLKIVKICK
jgi:hypothetical protein